MTDITKEGQTDPRKDGQTDKMIFEKGTHQCLVQYNVKVLLLGQLGVYSGQLLVHPRHLLQPGTQHWSVTMYVSSFLSFIVDKE